MTTPSIIPVIQPVISASTTTISPESTKENQPSSSGVSATPSTMTSAPAKTFYPAPFSLGTFEDDWEALDQGFKSLFNSTPISKSANNLNLNPVPALQANIQKINTEDSTSKSAAPVVTAQPQATASSPSTQLSPSEKTTGTSINPEPKLENLVASPIATATTNQPELPSASSSQQNFPHVETDVLLEEKGLTEPPHSPIARSDLLLSPGPAIRAQSPGGTVVVVGFNGFQRLATPSPAFDPSQAITDALTLAEEIEQAEQAKEEETAAGLMKQNNKLFSFAPSIPEADRVSGTPGVLFTAVSGAQSLPVSPAASLISPAPLRRSNSFPGTPITPIAAETPDSQAAFGTPSSPSVFQGSQSAFTTPRNTSAVSDDSEIFLKSELPQRQVPLHKLVLMEQTVGSPSASPTVSKLNLSAAESISMTPAVDLLQQQASEQPLTTSVEAQLAALTKVPSTDSSAVDSTKSTEVVIGKLIDLEEDPQSEGPAAGALSLSPLPPLSAFVGSSTAIAFHWDVQTKVTQLEGPVDESSSSSSGESDDDDRVESVGGNQTVSTKAASSIAPRPASPTLPITYFEQSEILKLFQDSVPSESQLTAAASFFGTLINIEDQIVFLAKLLNMPNFSLAALKKFEKHLPEDQKYKAEKIILLKSIDAIQKKTPKTSEPKESELASLETLNMYLKTNKIEFAFATFSSMQDISLKLTALSAFASYKQSTDTDLTRWCENFKEMRDEIERQNYVSQLQYYLNHAILDVPSERANLEIQSVLLLFMDKKTHQALATLKGIKNQITQLQILLMLLRLENFSMKEFEQYQQVLPQDAFDNVEKFGRRYGYVEWANNELGLKLS